MVSRSLKKEPLGSKFYFFQIFSYFTFRLQQFVMNLEDFQGTFKFKLIVPAVYIFSWISMVLGPIYYDRAYQIICMIVMLYSSFKTVWIVGCLVIAQKRLNRILDNQQSGVYKQFNDEVGDPIYHAIIVPSYRQQIEVLAETLEVLARHKKALTQYIIFLAMEAHQEGCDKKAKLLIERFKARFRGMAFTQHQLRQNQSKGKASNASWCTQHMPETFQKMFISKDDVIITALDADSWAPSLYFEEVDRYIRKNPEKRQKAVFSGPQIFTRNQRNISVFVRVSDMMHSFIHLASLPRLFFSFPLSNYSFSYNLIEKVGFWDTCGDAVGDDFHTPQKIYWKTRGDCDLAPIYVPFNQLSLEVKGGCFTNYKAKFWQSERHTQGVHDVAYNIKMLLTQPFRFANLVMTWFVFETFTLSAVIPWCMIGLIIRYIIMDQQGISGEGWVFSWLFVNIVLNVANLLNFIAYGIYQIYKRKSNKEIYGQTNDSLWRMLEFPLLFMVIAFTITVPSFTYSAFTVLCFKRTFHVTKKSINNAVAFSKNPQSKETKNIERLGSRTEQLINSDPSTEDSKNAERNNGIQMAKFERESSDRKSIQTKEEIEKNIFTL